jgi:RHS repeat-associated protein
MSWMHQDPVTKSQRVTDVNGAVTATKIDLDPWGGETRASAHTSTQPQRYTTYTRDQNGGDDAQMRRYSGAQQRFSQPDPYDGSYSLADPQSFNRYSYVQNDPVNFTDPSGLERFCYTSDTGELVCYNTEDEDVYRVNIWAHPLQSLFDLYLHGQNIRGEGQAVALFFPNTETNHRVSLVARPPQNPAQQRQGVERCSRPADLTSLGINWNVFGISHRWLRTPQVEAGATLSALTAHN